MKSLYVKLRDPAYDNLKSLRDRITVSRDDRSSDSRPHMTRLMAAAVESLLEATDEEIERLLGRYETVEEINPVKE